MRRIDLLEAKPEKRRYDSNWRTNPERVVAREFGFEYFDGDRKTGYGGYYYDGRWRRVVQNLQKIYRIDADSSVLDIGCAKGFLLFDLMDMIPGIRVAGIDISQYGLDHAMDGYGRFMEKQQGVTNGAELEARARAKVLPFMIKGSADDLPYVNDSFDVVLSINTSHNLSIDRCARAVQEMIRVSRNKKKMFIQLDSWKDDIEREAMFKWNLTALTIMGDDEWPRFLEECGYDGDYCGTFHKPADK